MRFQISILGFKRLIYFLHSPKSFVPKIQHCSHCWVGSKQVLLHGSLCSDVRPVPRLWNLHQPSVLITPLIVQLCISNVLFCFTSFSGHRPAQREQARTGLIRPMQGAIPTQSHNPWRLATPPGSTSPTLFEQQCGFFYVPHEQISESAVRWDLRFFVLIREDQKV